MPTAGEQQCQPGGKASRRYAPGHQIDDRRRDRRHGAAGAEHEELGQHEEHDAAHLQKAFRAGCDQRGGIEQEEEVLRAEEDPVEGQGKQPGDEHFGRGSGQEDGGDGENRASASRVRIITTTSVCPQAIASGRMGSDFKRSIRS